MYIVDTNLFSLSRKQFSNKQQGRVQINSLAPWSAFLHHWGSLLLKETTWHLNMKRAVNQAPLKTPTHNWTFNAFLMALTDNLTTAPSPGWYLAVQRWSSSPTCLRSRWRSAGGTWCARRRGSCGSARRWSQSSAARSRPPPWAPAQRRPAVRRAARSFKVIQGQTGFQWHERRTNGGWLLYLVSQLLGQRVVPEEQSLGHLDKTTGLTLLLVQHSTAQYSTVRVVMCNEVSSSTLLQRPQQGNRLWFGYNV